MVSRGILDLKACSGWAQNPLVKEIWGPTNPYEAWRGLPICPHKLTTSYRQVSYTKDLINIGWKRFNNKFQSTRTYIGLGNSQGAPARAKTSLSQLGTNLNRSVANIDIAVNISSLYSHSKVGIYGFRPIYSRTESVIFAAPQAPRSMGYIYISL